MMIFLDCCYTAGVALIGLLAVKVTLAMLPDRPTPASDRRRCRCGDPWTAHLHHRQRGSDCGLCRCRRYRAIRAGGKPAGKIQAGPPLPKRLPRAEKDSRARLGVPAYHPERVAIGEPGPALLALQDRLWPEGEWIEVIEATRREQGWGRP